MAEIQWCAVFLRLVTMTIITAMSYQPSQSTMTSKSVKLEIWSMVEVICTYSMFVTKHCMSRPVPQSFLFHKGSYRFCSPLSPISLAPLYLSLSLPYPRRGVWGLCRGPAYEDNFFSAPDCLRLVGVGLFWSVNFSFSHIFMVARGNHSWWLSFHTPNVVWSEYTLSLLSFKSPNVVILDENSSVTYRFTSALIPFSPDRSQLLSCTALFSDAVILTPWKEI